MDLKIVVLVISLSSCLANNLMNKCPIELEPIGCFADDVTKRTLTEQLINERDVTSEVHNGILIDWGNFETYLPEFLCRCATAAFNKGYRIIGLQFYGECWAGSEGHLSYNKYGTSDTCVDNKFKKKTNDTTKCIAGVGLDSTNYVYRIAPTACTTYYEPIGCFRDSQTKPRPLPNYISNERDFSIPNWNGILIEWENWNRYSPEMICRCASLAKRKGHELFGIQFWGECWSGVRKEVQYERDGSSTNCRAENFKPCPCNSYHCVGKAYTNHVYQLIDGPEI